MSSPICAKCGTAPAGTGKVLCSTCLKNLTQATTNFWGAVELSSTDTAITTIQEDASQPATPEYSRK